ncbi:MAG TPA: preprotein translocase subunit SecY, partial [Deltaproteobacteria bacterium]|nr:preprotein translocase subunit SecY [Deltaproteobacteria bacterium]
IAGMPGAVLNMKSKLDIGEINLLEIVLLAGFMFGVIMGIVFIERGQRRIPIQYAKRVGGRRIYG